MLIELADKQKYKHFFDLFQEIESKLGKVSYKYWVAGGCFTCHFTGSKINDYDFYTNDPKKFIEDLSKHYTEIKTDLPNAVNFQFGDTVLQVTDYPYDSPLRTIYNYDYTVCCIAFDGQNITRAETFWEDLSSRKLQIRKNNIHPFQAFERLVKYSKRGFNPTQETMLRVAKDLSKYPYAWEKIKPTDFRNF
jgi:hypothetical protein